MKNKIWKKVEVGYAGDIDGEILPITCLCGYGGYWEFTISIYPDNPYSCPKCGRNIILKMKSLFLYRKTILGRTIKWNLRTVY